MRWFTLVLLLSVPAARGGETEDGLAWQARSLRKASSTGYLAVVALTHEAEATPRATLVCPAEKLALLVDGNRWSVQAGETTTAQGWSELDSPARFSVKRTSTTILLGLNGQWVHGQSVDEPSGKASVRVGLGEGMAVQSMKIVPREPVRFADDFPDPVPQTGLWRPVCGSWALSSLSFPEQSANPAELAAVFDPLEDEGSRDRNRQVEIGIGVQLQGSSYASVQQVVGGSPADEAGMRQGDRITAVDGTSVRGADDANALLLGAEDATVKVTFLHLGKERTETMKRTRIVWGKTRRQVPVLPSATDTRALITTGYDFWTDYDYSVAARPYDVGGFGMVFAYLGQDDYHVFRWVGARLVREGCGQWRLERVRDGKRTLLAARDGGFQPNDFYGLQVRVHGDRPGELRSECFVDGRKVLEAADDALVPGLIGLWAEAPGAVVFDDVVVGEPKVEKVRGTKNVVQRTDRIMKAWADPAQLWVYVGPHWWNKQDFPGDLTLTTSIGTSPKSSVILGATRRHKDAGYRVDIGEGMAEVALFRQGERVAAEAVPGKNGQKLRVSRTGARIEAAIDGKTLLTYEDKKPILGSTIGVSGLLLADVAVESPNVVEDYFNGAPRDWHVMSGMWEVMNRWMCDPRWSFFGGRSDDLCAVWSKRRQEGDCFLGAHVGVMMLEMRGGYENMRDVGLTICGDGRNLDSGYTAIVGAASNSVTVLYRNGQPIDSTRYVGALLPRSSSGNELYSQHRGWVHFRLTKTGSIVRLYVWDQEVLSYADPDPLPGGYAAVWSVQNGLLIGKVRLAATRIHAPDPMPFLRDYPAFTDHVLTNEDNSARVAIEPNGSTHTVTNRIGGGTFAVALRPRVFSAFERPKLSFDVKLDPEAKIDLYLTCHGIDYRVRLTGPETDTGTAARRLGSFDGVEADGQWHTVSFDLLAALRKLHADDDLLMVWRPTLANYANDKYLFAGFGGNSAGTSYQLRNISLPFEGTAPALASSESQ
jgi:hypothetical protein